ncbi:hypothetical protein [Tenacibaculum aquimarinum]|uniref:hypothetical protein n=1 Tax=Tenacibaculum aquimarinum TaxID=2910675 RepID=UPI001F0B136A|nr:hypothetical protein [Tenacibaculum aquimarinum]MCH3885247.1 hypothetical protein [Tenacibaculum aquimarinum]
MKASIYIKILFIFLVLSSCNEGNSNIDITGKWSSYSTNKGYQEYVIDSLEIEAFYHWGGYHGKHKYSLTENITEETTIFIKVIDKNNIILNNSEMLSRVNDTVLAYHNSFYNSSDSVTSRFYINFQNRAHKKLY